MCPDERERIDTRHQKAQSAQETTATPCREGRGRRICPEQNEADSLSSGCFPFHRLHLSRTELDRISNVLPVSERERDSLPSPCCLLFFPFGE